MADDPQRETPDDPPERGRHPLTDPRPQTDPPDQRQRVAIHLPGMVRRPLLTYLLIAVNAAVFVVNFISPQDARDIYDWGIQLTENVVANREVYRLVTAMFLHADPLHVFFNCLALYYIGSQVERIFGHTRFGIIYLLGGLAGSVLSLFTTTGVLGASGAVFAIWGAEAVFLYRHRALFGAAAMARLRWTGFMVLFNFLIGIISNETGGRPIGNIAHLGGLVGGVILTVRIGPRVVIRRRANPQPGQPPVTLQQGNPLARRVRDVLFYSIGLAALLLLAIFIQT